MSQETWDMIQNSEMDSVELQMALQCAPLITGLKISNLLNIDKEDFPDMKKLIEDSYISWYLLWEKDDKMAILLYHQKSLERYLAKESVLKVFQKAGYQDFSLTSVLKEFCRRYQRYMENREDFPHEMGLLLGYPIEDVDGFIKHKGKDFLCTGYWKVYENGEGKLRLFERFKNAEETLIQLLSCGISMEDIIMICCSRMGTRMMQMSY